MKFIRWSGGVFARDQVLAATREDGKLRIDFIRQDLEFSRLWLLDDDDIESVLKQLSATPDVPFVA